MTNDERWARIDALFGEALDRPEGERLAYLSDATRDDPELFEAVRSLLERSPRAASAIGESVTGFAPGLLEAFAGGTDPADDPSPPGPGGRSDDPAGRMVGPYRILSELGRGGMGTVYLAERADGEFERRVALKLVKRGMDTDEILRRFRFERRILASLEHPNIARLYDGGATPDGQPYLAMELVAGRRIRDYCDERSLPLEDRLALFGEVCKAVQHAHQRLVVHRDLKPSNLLVTHGGVPKLLDFGIAKLLGDEEADGPMTRTGVRILTPEYAAPEQIRGEPVTTATDVYALGAILHELLTGTPPVRTPGASAWSRPSTVAVGIPGTSPSVLRKRLQGDLDTILLKALEEDPADRYPSAQDLMEDLVHYRKGQPIRARPATLRYRARKFARRHRSWIASAALLLLALSGGLAVALWQAAEAAAAREVAEGERRVAEEERDVAEELAAFLEGVFTAPDPFAARAQRPDTLRVGAVLDRSADRAATEFAERPAVQARMLGALGRTYRSLGRYDRAEALLSDALQATRRAHGAEHLDVAFALNSLGLLLLDQGRPAEAEPLHREALEIRRTILGNGHPRVMESTSNLASALQNAGRLDEAESLYDEVLDFHRRADPPDSTALALALNARMVLAFRKDDMDAALTLARESLELTRAIHGEVHPLVTQGMNNLAQVLSRTGALEESEGLFRRSLETNRELLGPDHPNVAAGAMNLAGVLLRQDRDDEAEALYLQALEVNRRVLGDGHPTVAVGLNNYADVLVRRGEHATAEPMYREALAITRLAFGSVHRDVGIVEARLAASLCAQGRGDEGRVAWEEALGTLRASLPDDHSLLVRAEADATGCGEGR